MGIVKSIIDKMKIKELFAIIFVAAILITLIPGELAQKFKIDGFRNTYQTYISICILVLGSYYLLGIVSWIRKLIWGKIYNPRKAAINYMKNTMNADEMGLLIEKYYDSDNNMFRSTAMIEFSDGRKAALESKFILYRASSMSEWYSFAYNLQPYALEFLNKNLCQGNIEVQGSSFKYKLL